MKRTAILTGAVIALLFLAGCSLFDANATPEQREQDAAVAEQVAEGAQAIGNALAPATGGTSALVGSLIAAIAGGLGGYLLDGPRSKGKQEAAENRGYARATEQGLVIQHQQELARRDAEIAALRMAVAKNTEAREGGE